MRLYFLGSREEFERALLTDDYTEWSVGFGPGVLLRAERPPSLVQAVVVLEIPRQRAVAYARGHAWPGEYLVPPDVAAAHDLGPA